MILNSALVALILYAIGAAFALTIWGYVLGRKFPILVIALAGVWMISIPALIVMTYTQMGVDIRGWLGHAR